MTCPSCQQPTTPAQERCPRCAAPLLTLAPGTRLYHRYVLKHALSRRGVVTYAATDESSGQVVTVLEYLPAGTRRMGQLAILDDAGLAGRASFALRAERWKQRPQGALQRVAEVFAQLGTTYAVLPDPPLPDPPPLLLQGEQLGGILRAALGALELLHADGAVGPFRVQATPPMLLLEPAARWPDTLAAPELLAGHQDTPASDLYALAALLLTATAGQALPTPPQRAMGRPLPTLPADVPAGVRAALLACLAVDSSVRPQTAAQVLSQLTVPMTSTTAALTPRWIRPAHRSWVTHLQLDGGLLHSTGPDQQVLVHDAAGGVVWRLDGLLGRPVGVIAMPGTTIVADASGTLHAWSRGQHVQQRGPVPVERLAALPDGGAVTLNDDHTLARWTTDPLDRRGSAPLTVDWVTAMGTTPAGAVLLGDGRGGMWRFDTDTAQVSFLGASPVGGAVTTLAAAADILYTVAGRSLVAWPAGEAPAVVWTAPQDIRAAVPEPSGDRVFVAAGRDVYDVAVPRRRAAPLYRAPSPVLSLALDGRDLAAGTEGGQLVMLTVPDAAE